MSMLLLNENFSAPNTNINTSNKSLLSYLILIYFSLLTLMRCAAIANFIGISFFLDLAVAKIFFGGLIGWLVGAFSSSKINY